ncbi:MAG: VanZ family protein [Planctomycetes bacterium]|nr:VanZ family protein [Planctomycetota bacterium]
MRRSPLFTCGAFLLRWPRLLGAALALVWIAGLHLGSLVERRGPDEESPSAVMLFYNWLHCPAYAALATWMLLALRSAPRSGAFARPLLLRAWLLTALVGFSDEVHQACVPWRDGDPFDFATDALAAGGALWVLAGVAAARDEGTLWRRLFATIAATLGTAALAARHSF